MERWTNTKGLLIRMLLLCAFAAPAYAQPDGPPPPPPRFDGGRPPPPMPMLRNDIRLEHRRQGAKCMNAYPEDHGAFVSCIENERAGSPFQSGRRQFMPMPPDDHE